MFFSGASVVITGLIFLGQLLQVQWSMQLPLVNSSTQITAILPLMLQVDQLQLPPLQVVLELVLLILQPHHHQINIVWG
jgi:hypothetical protein